MAVQVDVMVFTPILRLEPATVRALCLMESAGPLTVVLQRDNPAGKPYEDHLHQYQRGRRLFLVGGYDAMLVIESDIIPPQDTLQRLAALGVDVAYGSYLFRGDGQPVTNILERYYSRPETRHKPARNIGEPLSERGLYQAAVRQGVIDCSGSGLGCILIKRNVVEAVPFERPPAGGFFDMAWTEAVYRAGYRMKADMSVKCGHVNKDGSVLWPDS